MLKSSQYCEPSLFELFTSIYLLEVEDPGLWLFVLETGLDPEMKAEIVAELDNLVHTYVRPPSFLEQEQIRHHQPFLKVSNLGMYLLNINVCKAFEIVTRVVVLYEQP